MRPILVAVIILALSCSWEPLMNASEQSDGAGTKWMESAAASLENELTATCGESERTRVRRGLAQVAALWRDSDGGRVEFEAFVREHFARNQDALDVLFNRYQQLLEQTFGHMNEISRALRHQIDVDAGPVEPYDELFAAYDPSAHLIADWFDNRLAFVALLNFPLTTLTERLAEGGAWTRREWAETRLAEYFSRRVPADVNLAISKASAGAGRYISEYNLWMHHIVDDRGRRLFPPKMRLLSHWNLRDQIKADYADDNADRQGLARQRAIQQVMERIVTQTIPAAVINNPQLDWNPFANEVRPAGAKDSDFVPENAKAAGPEPDTRYLRLLETYRAARLADPHSPSAPTMIARRFNEDRQIPEARVEEMFTQVLSSPLVPRVAALIRTRLGRPLEPFDIWYSGFRVKSARSGEELDALVAGRYPTAQAYQRDIPSLLEKLGFARDRARSVAENIVVDPARGSGHAMGAAMRQGKARLRTRVEKSGMNYKGFNIAVHEMGHNVEQTFSLNDIDYYSLNGVPNTAFTEALAFVFQARDLELLGVESRDSKAEALNALKTLNDFWATYEICGVSLVDMRVWRWMYEHPQATPPQLKRAVIDISTDVWNRFYAPVFLKKDAVLLGIYSHMIDSFLYLPDYPLGHMIAFQLEEHISKAGKIGPEFERVARQGRLTPDLWMKEATGASVGPEALLSAAERALSVLQK